MICRQQQKAKCSQRNSWINITVAELKVDLIFCIPLVRDLLHSIQIRLIFSTSSCHHFSLCLRPSLSFSSLQASNRLFYPFFQLVVASSCFHYCNDFTGAKNISLHGVKSRSWFEYYSVEMQSGLWHEIDCKSVSIKVFNQSTFTYVRVFFQPFLRWWNTQWPWYLFFSSFLFYLFQWMFMRNLMRVEPLNLFSPLFSLHLIHFHSIWFRYFFPLIDYPFTVFIVIFIVIFILYSLNFILNQFTNQKVILLISISFSIQIRVAFQMIEPGFVFAFNYFLNQVTYW